GRDESKKTQELNLSDKGNGETKVFNYTTVAEKDVNAAKPVSTAGDAVNVASVIPDVSAVGPSTSTARDIFEDEMTTIDDTLMAIRRTRPRTTSVVIRDVEEGPMRTTPPPIETNPIQCGPPKKVSDEAVYTGEDDRVVRAVTTAASLEAEQESGRGPRRHVTTLGDTDAQTRFETASKQSHSTFLIS
nr:hypothetical protein [Tanacetum cinerariifolium]